MTLPASFPLSMSQVASELGTTLPISLNHIWILALAQKSGLPVSMSDLLGKTGRFDGNVFVNASGIGSFGSAPFFGAQLNRLTVSFSTVDVSTITAPPNFTGSIRIRNNTTGVSTILTNLGSGVWENASSPANLVRANQTDNFTLTPA
ncbi:hypothetical protein F0160_22735 [Paraburkholderia sp. JPY303]|uniref:hypothetical protein n=1 Tax=Paraburkholderia atlantica TaxID=2654982 RepID=UPI001591FC3E|nr:hypothetical protein [Paraburkholderia atlantica]NUY33305.1 hypothetical protein [Paraburkholderia atlantica]